MKWKKPKLIDLSDKIALGQCLPGAAPGAYCQTGTSATQECAGGNNATWGCGGGNMNINPACSGGSGPDTCGGGAAG